MGEKYLLDSNVFITPYRVYYPFDLAPGFWNQLEQKLQLDNVSVLDVVLTEISKFEDELSNWIGDLENFEPMTIKSESIVANYRRVLMHVQDCGLYQEKALRDWSNRDIADPWLIAVAMDTNATIITEEVPSGTGLSEKNKAKNAKIPDVANHFGIKCENLFYFMRQTKFKL